MGIFLAVLELVRRGRLSTRQERLFDEIWLEPPASTPAPEPS
jgi:chromatin segregation and condensation protein Rec8/ScpA/Scc1 (kleisin family)